MVAGPVRSMRFDGDKFGESREAVHSELLTQLVASDDIPGGGGPREARLQEKKRRREGWRDRQGGNNNDKIGEINQGRKTKSLLKPKAKTKERSRSIPTHKALRGGGVCSESGYPPPRPAFKKRSRKQSPIT